MSAASCVGGLVLKEALRRKKEGTVELTTVRGGRPAVPDRLVPRRDGPSGLGTQGFHLFCALADKVRVPNCKLSAGKPTR